MRYGEHDSIPSRALGPVAYFDQKPQCLAGRFPEPFDIIFGTDVVYSKTVIVPLWQSVCGLLAHHPDAVFVCGHIDRSREVACPRPSPGPCCPLGTSRASRLVSPVIKS